MVTKANSKRRICENCANLNKACPKDSYPFPNINWQVDGASNHKMLSFLKAYSDFNQIRMHLRDKEKTTFMTNGANYYYKIMWFGLKNAGEAYMDNIVIKSDSCDQHIKNLEEVFEALRWTSMRLNLEKCTFDVEGKKFLGFMLTHQEIEANSNRCRAIIEIRSLQNVKVVQQLIGCLTVLSRFVPQLVKRTLSMVQLLHNPAKFS